MQIALGVGLLGEPNSLQAQTKENLSAEDAEIVIEAKKETMRAILDKIREHDNSPPPPRF